MAECVISAEHKFAIIVVESVLPLCVTLRQARH